MKFAADCMLGTLAKWLILLGHDVAYFPRIEDHELVQMARREGRTILTRDRRLVQRRDAKDHIPIRTHNLRHQIPPALAEPPLRLSKDIAFPPGVNRYLRPLAGARTTV